jgi:site-specific DNA-methyltransferase (adenine-specific)
MTHQPGSIRDSIIRYLSDLRTDATIADIYQAVVREVGGVSASSVRSYLNLNTPGTFDRAGRGRYRLKSCPEQAKGQVAYLPAFQSGRARLYQADCFEWLANQKPNSVHAVVTDPPYGLVEYTAIEQAKLSAGRGGVWRIPPSFDGHKRAPLPRFTDLDADDLKALQAFFKRLGALLLRVVVPGGNVVVASNPLLSHIVASGLADGGLEIRGSIARLVMTMRGGDRPKNAHLEFPDVSVMPRSMWEPWVIMRRPLEGRASDNLRQWKTGGFRRLSADQPFGDVIKSAPTSKAERAIAPHPSLKPQAFLRQIVGGVLPLGEGVILDCFAGSGSTLAAANALGLDSVGVEADPRYVKVAQQAIPKLSSFALVNPVSPQLLDTGPVKRGRPSSKGSPRIAAKVGNRHVG